MYSGQLKILVLPLVVLASSYSQSCLSNLWWLWNFNNHNAWLQRYFLGLHCQYSFC